LREGNFKRKKAMKVTFLTAALLFGTSVALKPRDNVRTINQETTGGSGVQPSRRRVWIRYSEGQHESLLSHMATQSLSAVDGTTEKMELHYDFPKSSSIVATVTLAQIKALQANPDVVSITDDPQRYLIKPVQRSDHRRELVSLQWQDQAINYGINMVQASVVWNNHGLTGEGITVCVMDTGFQLVHPDFNSANYTGDSLVPGYIWSEDLDGHGTHVTGTIAAANNNIGLVGVAPDATIHVVGIFDGFGSIYSSSLVEAAYKCRDAGAKIISMSIGGDYPLQEEQDAFNELFTKDGILSIAAAGNNGYSSYSYPGSYDHVLAVGAIDRLRIVAPFSQYNDRVDLVAPGVNVWSTLPTNYKCYLCTQYASSGYVSLDGTSQATPHVSAVAALLWSFNSSLDVLYIQNALLASALDLGDPGRDVFYGQGLVQAVAAFTTLNATLHGAPLQDWTDKTSLNGVVTPTCKADELLVKVDLLTDRYGNETFWEVFRGTDGFPVMAGAGFLSEKAYNASMCLPSNCYTVSIRDSFGDGICCSYGTGQFNFTVNGKIVLSAGNFTDSASTTFGGNCTALSHNPKPPCVEAKLSILTDSYPTDIAVSLVDLSTGNLFWTDVVFANPNAAYTLLECLDPTGCYNFTITDIYGDGLCCFDGYGYFNLTFGGKEVFSGGDFGFSATHQLGNGCKN
jgi:hypothetical protein